jgi:hypothetical protein
MKGLGQWLDVAVFETELWLACSADDNIHHGASQIISLNLIWE